VAGREGKRGECQTRLGLVWRETGAVRNARPSRGRAASTRKRAQWDKLRSYLANDSGAGRVGGAFGRCIGRSPMEEGSTQFARNDIRKEGESWLSWCSTVSRRNEDQPI